MIHIRDILKKIKKRFAPESRVNIGPQEDPAQEVELRKTILEKPKQKESGPESGYVRLSLRMDKHYDMFKRNSPRR